MLSLLGNDFSLRSDDSFHKQQVLLCAKGTQPPFLRTKSPDPSAPLTLIKRAVLAASSCIVDPPSLVPRKYSSRPQALSALLPPGKV